MKRRYKMIPIKVFCLDINGKLLPLDSSLCKTNTGNFKAVTLYVAKCKAIFNLENKFIDADILKKYSIEDIDNILHEDCENIIFTRDFKYIKFVDLIHHTHRKDYSNSVKAAIKNDFEGDRLCIQIK